jgi:lysyl-tRNA synthetase class 2
VHPVFLSDQELQRREELRQLQELGIDPFPAAAFEVSMTCGQIADGFGPDVPGFESLSLAGRVTNKRIMGKASFAELQDDTGVVQLYLNRDDLCPGEDKTLYNEVFKKLISPGDIIGVHGYAFMTQTGEKTVHVQQLHLLSKTLRPIPFPKDTGEKLYETFHDQEQRSRMRYLDLIVHPQVRERFRKRSQMIRAMRNFLDGQGYLEVETPVLQPIYGGASARPFKTHHNTLDMTLYLRIANELYLKRLIVGGYTGVYEFAKDFRNEGMSPYHNPEFTMMELYVAYKDYEWMMNLVEEMIEQVAIAVAGSTVVQVGENQIDFRRPWKRYTMYESIHAFTGVDVSELDEEGMRAAAAQMGIAVDSSMGRGKLIDEIFGAKVEPHLIQPTFITDYPVEMSPLAKKHRSKPGLVERFEAICNRKEICNAFSELNDPLDQRERFEAQLKLGLRGDEEAMMLDEDFLRALEYGMPPTAGLGIGIDRLAMIMTNANHIREVLFFPHMRPEDPPAPVDAAGFAARGVPEAFHPLLEKLGVNSLDALDGSNPNKLHQQLCDLNKRYKLGLENPAREAVAAWLADAP